MSIIRKVHINDIRRYISDQYPGHDLNFLEVRGNSVLFHSIPQSTGTFIDSDLCIRMSIIHEHILNRNSSWQIKVHPYSWYFGNN